jgi:hypothetical protein
VKTLLFEASKAAIGESIVVRVVSERFVAF